MDMIQRDKHDTCRSTASSVLLLLLLLAGGMVNGAWAVIS